LFYQQNKTKENKRKQKKTKENETKEIMEAKKRKMTFLVLVVE
jgi:hypothetical protein